MSKLPAIVLAAGLSSRMGAFKPLLQLGEKALLVHVVDALWASGGISEVIIVAGHRAGEIEAALFPLPAHVRLIHNERFAEGEMLSSIQTGVRALLASAQPPAGGFLLAFADQPAVRAETVRALVAGFFEGHPFRPPLALPVYAGKRGHPVVFSTTLAPAILSLAGSETLRSVVHQHLSAARLIPVEDPSVLEDLDTPEDFERALRNGCDRPATST